MDSTGLAILIVSVLAFTFIERCSGQITSPPTTVPPTISTATTPVGAVTTAPPGAVTTPPPGAVTTPPPGAVTTPPPGAVTTPPPGAVTTPPPGAVTTPPPGAVTTPPPGAVTTSAGTTPVGGSTTPAAVLAANTDAKPKWDFEYTTLKKGKVCIKGNPDSITHCKNLKDELVAVNFHADRKLTNLEGGNCLYLSDGPVGTTATPPTEPKGPLRCVYKGQYQGKEKVEAVRLHFFNNNGDPRGKGDVVLLVAYWGDAKQPQNLIETPLS